MILSEKVALITGSSRGIGCAIAKLFAQQGAKIIVHYKDNKQEAEKALATIKELGSTGLLMQADVKDKKQIGSMVKGIIERFGRIDILVNNAGIRKDALMLTMHDENWHDVLETNLNSVYYLCKAIGKQMVIQKSGVIVNISSLSGVCGRIAQTNYAASKSGMIGITKSLALELARWKIRVNAVIPGMIETDMTENLNPQTINSLNIPLQRLGRPEEVAQCALFLASNMSTYITGTTIAVNGGAYT